MKNYKKASALIACLLISSSSIMPAMSTYAHNKDESSSSSEAVSDSTLIEIAPNSDVSEEAEEFASGDFKYIKDINGDAIITDCTSAETELVIPDTLDGIKVIGINSKALMKKTFTKITIPATVSDIDNANPFSSLTELQEIVVDADNSTYKSVDGVMYTKDGKKIICYPCAKSGDTFTIPDGVETVGVAAVSSTSLKEIILPDSVSVLERHCFSFNENLQKLHMDNTVIEEIGIMSVAECPNLTDLKFSDSTTYIELGAFMSCLKLEDVLLPPNLEYVGQSAFLGTAMKKVVIPQSVADIGYCAFGYDNDEKPIEDFVIIGVANTYAQTYATDTDEEYEIYNDFRFINYSNYEKQLEYESFDKKVSGDFEYTVIDGKGMITSCSSTGRVINVPSEIDGVEINSIFFNAFLACPAASIVIPDTVTEIDKEVFPSTLTELTLSGNCAEIEGEELFLRYSNLTSITVTEGNGAYSSENGVLYNKDKTVLIAYPALKPDTEFTLPDTVKEISKSGFCYNISLESADLSNVEIIDEYAFEGCTSLKNVKLPDTLKRVEKNAFLGCYSMSSLRVPDSVEYIAEYAFGYDYDPELANDIETNMEAYVQSGQSVIMPYSVIDGFKMYVEEDSLAHRYAKDCGIDVVLNTLPIGSKNINKGIVYAVVSAAAAVILLIIGVFTGKKLKARKNEKAAEKRKAVSAERMKAKKETAKKKEEAAYDSILSNSEEVSENESE